MKIFVVCILAWATAQNYVIINRNDLLYTIIIKIEGQNDEKSSQECRNR